MTAPYEPEVAELELYRGLPWELEINYAPDEVTANLTSVNVRFTVRESDDDTSDIVVDFTQADSEITRGSTDPNLTIAISDADTTALAVNEHAWYWLAIDNLPVAHGPFRIRKWGAQ